MSVNLSPLGGVAAQFFNNDGVPLSGGLIYTYLAGTNTPANTYTNGAGNIAHPNPIVLDSSGRVPTGEIWLTDSLAYKFVIKDSTLNLIGTYDNIVGINSNFVNYTASQEIQTATAGQTVFTLTTMAYQPGTNSLSVFVDGVNQYGPGAQYAFTETNSTTVTFADGLHVGASVKFTTAVINNIGGVDASQVTYNPPFTGSVATNVEAKLAQTVSVKDFGAIGSGGVDDTAAIQLALDSGAGAVYFPAGTYNITTLLVRASNIEIYGDGTATVLNSTDNSVFCAIALIENYTNIYLHDFKLQGCATSEIVGVYRGIVNGTNSAGTSHSTASWSAYNRVERIYITGETPGTNGFNVACQFNKANYSSFSDCYVDSVYGTNVNYGHGIVCNGTGQQILNNRFISTISNQGRHAIYATSEPIAMKIVGNYCQGFQNNGISTNTSASGGYDVLIDNNTVFDCVLTATGTTAAAICVNGIYGAKVTNNTIRGTTQSSNKMGITIAIADSGATSSASIVANNYISGTIEDGIYVQECDYVRVVDNVILTPDAGNTGTFGGIEIQQSNYGLYQGNIIRSGGTYRFGIRINLTATISNNNMIYDNQIVGSPTYQYENSDAVASNVFRLPLNDPKTVTFVAATGNQTIDVSQNARVVTNIQPSSGTLTITNLTNAYQGQIVTLVTVTSNVVIKNGNFKTTTGGDLTPSPIGTVTFVYIGTKIGRAHV